MRTYESLGNYASKANNKGKHSVGKVGGGGESPPSPLSFLHLALHDVIQAALAAPLWDQTEKLQLEFYSVNYFEIFFSLTSECQEFIFLSIRVNYQIKPMVKTDADKNNLTFLETN